eukprot:TRINITY_DN40571_c0_g1_i1.p1 TRINITY_DN40571_c0_g1~~TRINITY_DN40571_c0_g1_i1.p1  ORF type:complete len:387 (-),score=125.82 TRINITY_DN40571_c0_g1_i1:25-1185(-)
MKDLAIKSGDTTELNLVGVNFKPNSSLSTRYTAYLSTSPLTCPTTLLYSTPSCVVIATGKKGSLDPLTALAGLAVRNGFTRCSGRLFAMQKISDKVETFYSELDKHLPRDIIIRTHAHPPQFSRDILEYIHIDAKEEFKHKNISSSPTNFSHLLVAVMLDSERVGWGLYSIEQYRQTISRPGDGDRLPNFELNFNRAELKIAEAMQLLSEEEKSNLFQDDLLGVDVGAAPGGWTGFLANYEKKVSVIAIDPAELDPAVGSLDNVLHLQHKAEVVSDREGDLLARSGEELMGDNWSKKFRFLVCDANMDIRDTLRELVLPLALYLAPGGVLVVTLKLGRRVGVEGVARREENAHKMLVEAGFQEESIRIHWLFGNSKNERTIFAVKK